MCRYRLLVNIFRGVWSVIRCCVYYLITGIRIALWLVVNGIVTAAERLLDCARDALKSVAHCILTAFEDCLAHLGHCFYVVTRNTLSYCVHMCCNGMKDSCEEGTGVIVALPRGIIKGVSWILLRVGRNPFTTAEREHTSLLDNPTAEVMADQDSDSHSRPDGYGKCNV